VGLSTLQRSLDTTPAADEPAARRPTAAELLRRYPVLAVGVLLLGISTALVLWARTRPGFDPYGWLVWGHQTISGSLDTNAAPSWKPFPYVFAVPYALFGHYELWLWMITSVAVSLSGVVFAGAVAYRLTVDPADVGSIATSPGGELAAPRRYAASVAAVVAGAALLGIADYSHYILSYQSDPMIVALCLGAVYWHLSGRHRWAFVFGALAALGRPEVWPFLAAYTVWAWRAVPSMRWLLAAGVVAVLLLWFGVPALTSRSPFVAASNAMGSGRRLHSNRVFGTIGRFVELQEAGIWLAALLAVGLAARRRERTALALAAGVVAWVVIEVAFALHGWPGLGRYMFEAAGVAMALAGAAVGRVLVHAPAKFTWAGAAVAAAIVISLVPTAISRARVEHRDLRVQRARTTQVNRLAGVVSRYGGPARFRPCGEPLTRLEYQTVLAWTLRRNVVRIGFKYGPAIRSRRPIVLFTPLSHGRWMVQALHQRSHACRMLPH
jgi:hypothetical protein